MEIKIREEGAVTIVSVAGSMDAQTAPDLAHALHDRLQNGYFNLVIDLASLNYTSSAGLRVLLSATKEARTHGGDVRIAAPQPMVNNVFEMSGLNSVLKFYPEVATAVTSYAV